MVARAHTMKEVVPVRAAGQEKYQVRQGMKHSVRKGNSAHVSLPQMPVNFGATSTSKGSSCFLFSLTDSIRASLMPCKTNATLSDGAEDMSGQMVEV